MTRFIRGLRARPEHPGEFDRIVPHLVEERCAPCLFTVRELMAEAEPELREGLRRLVHPEEYSEDENEESLAVVLRQTDRRAWVIQAERALAPELLAELAVTASDTL